MNAILKTKETVVMILLCLATLVSCGVSLLPDSDASLLAASFLMLVAFGKASLVFYFFMEVARAPTALRAWCSAWIVVSFSVIVGSYWLYDLAGHAT